MPVVQYTYSEMAGGANHSRLTSMTYPSGRAIDYDYASGLDDSISRLTTISDSTGTLESYLYLGLGTVVDRSHPEIGVDLTYIAQPGDASQTGDVGDKYTGLDRFGRVVDQRWLNTSTGTATDQVQYGYDRNGNVLYQNNLVNNAFSQVFSYDGLNQLTLFQRGTLNTSETGSPPAESRTGSYVFS
jgi:hypothetical protein